MEKMTWTPGLYGVSDYFLLEGSYGFEHFGLGIGLKGLGLRGMEF